MRKTVVFWQETVSHHQWPVLSALAQELEWRVIWAIRGSFEDGLREKMGWPKDFSEGIEMVPTLDRTAALDLARGLEAGAKHVFSGVFRPGVHREAMNFVVGQGETFSMMAEPPFPSRVPMVIKRWGQQRFFRRYRSQLESMFAIGHIAVDWYRSVGLSEAQVVPWAYFPPEPESRVNQPRNERFRVIFIGQVNDRKGTRFLCDALAQSGADVDFDLVGDGEDLDQCLQVLAGSNVKVVGTGFVAYSQAMERLSSADLCVVPSRHDGWGAVTNEALRRGVPVIATRQCGSADLITNNVLGDVVEFGDTEGIMKRILSRVAAGPLNPGERNEIVAASESFSPIEGARFFNQVLQEPNRVHRPPWVSKQSQ